MIFSIPKMSCSHCTSAIEKGIKAKDPSAIVTTDLDLRLVTVQSDLAQTDIQQAIADAGYAASAA